MTVRKDDDSNNSLDFEESYVNVDSPDVVTAFSDDGEDASTMQQPAELPLPLPEATPIPIPIPASVAPSTVTEDYSLPPDSNTNTAQRQNHDENTRQVGAGVLTAVVAAPILGPFLAVVAGVAAAYGSTQPGSAGDACRAAGDVAMMAKDKAVEVNQKHNIVDNTSNGAKGVIAKLQDVNIRFQIVNKMKLVLEASFRHLGEAFKFASGKMKKSRKGPREHSEWDGDVDDGFSRG
jgi:hypothetical protein